MAGSGVYAERAGSTYGPEMVGAEKQRLGDGLAAAISAGRRVFFENEVPDEFMDNKPEKVIFFSSEDSLEYTLKARLRKAGANMDNIYSVSLKDERFSQIKFNSQLLKDLIREVKPALVVFDPLQAFIPPEIQMGQRNAMRNCLNPLIGLGEEYGTTFLVIVHTNKRQGTYGRNRIADSADVWDIARSVMIVGQTQEKDIRYMSHEKCNYGELQSTALFTINDGVAEFMEYTDHQDADFVRERDFAAYQAPQRQDAEKFIIDYLKMANRKPLIWTRRRKRRNKQEHFGKGKNETAGTEHFRYEVRGIRTKIRHSIHS